MTSTSFTIHWHPPESDGGSPIQNYVIEKREVGKKTWQKVGITNRDVLHIEVKDLQVNSSWNFRIVAVNAVGMSDPFLPEDPITAGKRISKYRKIRKEDKYRVRLHRRALSCTSFFRRRSISSERFCTDRCHQPVRQAAMVATGEQWRHRRHRLHH